MSSGRLSARRLAAAYIARIRALDQAGPAVNSVIELNPDALEIASALDRERKTGGAAGRCTGYRSCSRTTSRPPTRWRPPPARSRWSGSAHPRRAPRDAPARRRCRDPRQDQPQRMGEHALTALDQRLERSRRADAQPLRARPQHQRLELRLGRGDRRQLRRGSGGHETDGSIVSPASINGLVASSRRSASSAATA